MCSSDLAYLRIASFCFSLKAPLCARIKLLLLELVMKSLLIFILLGQRQMRLPRTSFFLMILFGIG